MLLNVLRCRMTYLGQAETSAEAWFNIALRPRKPEGSLGRTAQYGHLDSHTAPELCPGDDDEVGLHVLGCRVDILGTNCNSRISKNCAVFTEVSCLD